MMHTINQKNENLIWHILLDHITYAHMQGYLTCTCKKNAWNNIFRQPTFTVLTPWTYPLPIITPTVCKKKCQQKWTEITKNWPLCQKRHEGESYFQNSICFKLSIAIKTIHNVIYSRYRSTTVATFKLFCRLQYRVNKWNTNFAGYPKYCCVQKGLLRW